MAEIRIDAGYYLGKPIPFPHKERIYNPATTKARVFGFDGVLHYVNEDGTSYAMLCPSITPFDDDQKEWPKTALHFVEMGGIQYAVMASTMREACAAIEKANGWD